MKNLIKKCTLLIVLFLTITVSGKSNFDDFRISTLNSNTLNFQLSNSDGNSDVKIYDEEGILLYQEAILGSIFSKKFNFNLLPDGKYKIEVVGQTRITTFPFKIENATIKVFENDKSVVYKPIVWAKDDLLYISKFLGNEKEAISMALYDNDVTLYQIKPRLMKSFEKTLDIRNLPKGNYKLVVNYGDRSLVTTIKK